MSPGCDMCDGQAAYTRKYSGQKLCSGCFSRSITRKVAKTISRYKMIQNGELVAVAVSGGKDSLALLRVMKEMADMHNFGIEAITVDEGIPGYRDEALEIVRSFCGGLDVRHTVVSYEELFSTTLEAALDQRGGKKMSSCSICGTLRRRAMDHAAGLVGADVIATGHNLDDMLQTFMINMLSGDTGKIGWMNPDTSSNQLRKIKPFCEIYEEEVVFYAFTNDIPFQTEACPHADEGIRTEIRQFLNSLEGRHSGIKNNLYRSVLRTSEMIRDFDGKKRVACTVCGSQCTGKICSVCSMMSDLGRKPNANIT